MTRNILKDTPTQVNSTLIGVEVVPGDGETANCTVSYSVTGQDWTQHETVLTETNNVIGSIPRYIFLKFSQDVIITLE